MLFVSLRNHHAKLTNFLLQQKIPLKIASKRAINVLRTGIEQHMIISKLPYLQAVLQAVKSVFNIFMLRPQV